MLEVMDGHVASIHLMLKVILQAIVCTFRSLRYRPAALYIPFNSMLIHIVACAKLFSRRRKVRKCGVPTPHSN